MENLTTVNIALFAALVIPGFLSIRVYGLFFPVARASLKDEFLEALAFGVFNMAAMSWAIMPLLDAAPTQPSLINGYLTVVLVFVIAPCVWPVLLFFSRRALASRGLILEPYKNAWDSFFARRQPCWVIVHLKDGRRLGGWYGPASYASLYPQSGHLYLETLWKLDEDGAFSEPVPRSRGIVLRPDDYHFLELFRAEEAANAQSE